MPAIYNVAVKTAAMTARRDHFANGTLEILNVASAVLVTFGLDAAGGTVSGAVWTPVFDASTVAAGASGKATKAQFKTSGGSAHLTGLIVSSPWVASRAYTVGEYAKNDSGKIYRCTTAGTSAASGGPTGTGGSITDGGVTWAYEQAAEEINLDNTDITSGQNVSLTSAAITHAA